MNSATYSQLTAFHAIVNEGSIVAAARKLEIAPPSVSKSLKQLEKQIGQPLFHRTTRRIELTDAGRFLWQSTQDSLSRLQSAVEIVQDFVNEASGSLRISVVRHAYLSLLRDHLGEFCQRYPNIQLEISLSDGKVDLLKDGFDLGIRFGDRLDDSPVARQLTPPIVQGLFASRDYVAQHGTPQQPEELAEHCCLRLRLPTSGGIMPWEFQLADSIYKFQPQGNLIANNRVLLEACLAHQGLLWLPLDSVAEPLANGSLVECLAPYRMCYQGYHLYYPNRHQHSPLFQALVGVLREE